MTLQPRWVLGCSLALAGAIFCVVQDRVTAGAAERYVAMQRDALAGRRDPVTIDEVMRPAVERSVRQGAAYGTAVAATGVVLALALRRR